MLISLLGILLLAAGGLWLAKRHHDKQEKPRDGAVCEIRLGLPGDGKSLDQTLQAVIPHLLADEEVWCCYWINWNKPNYHYFAPRDFNAVKDLRNVVIVFDELAQTFEPRDWEGESSQVRAFFQLHRHRHVDIYANTQDVSLVAKTIGIIASTWIKCVKINPHWLMDWIGGLFGSKNIVNIHKHYMSYQEVKKEANGWELGEIIEQRGDIVRQNYKLEDILCQDLDEYKVETIHRYCPKCCSRQGEQIKKENNNEVATYYEKEKAWRLKKTEYCPKHKDTELEIRYTGMYDTDYEPEVKEVKVKFKPFVPCPEGWREIEFKGNLSENQKRYVKNLSNKFN